jgi:Fe-S cluster biosynthesis and repair protein YggX
MELLKMHPAVIRSGRFSLKFYFQRNDSIAKKIIEIVSKKLGIAGVEKQIMPLINDNLLELCDLTEIPSLYNDFRQVLGDITKEEILSYVLNFIVQENNWKNTIHFNILTCNFCFIKFIFYILREYPWIKLLSSLKMAVKEYIICLMKKGMIMKPIV